MTTVKSRQPFARRALLALAIASQGAGLAATNAYAEHDTFFVRIRGIAVVPQDDSTAVFINGVTPIGGSSVSVTDDYKPELDITYKFAPNWGVELIAGVTNHQVNAKGSIAALGEVIDTWVLPPTLTLQYHFNPHGTLRPYVGAGVNYTNFFDEEVKGPLYQPGARVDVENSWGYALQAGVDYEFSERWFINADIKYLDIDTRAEFVGVNVGGATTNLAVDVDIDPVVFGLGVGYRF